MTPTAANESRMPNTAKSAGVIQLAIVNEKYAIAPLLEQLCTVFSWRVNISEEGFETHEYSYQ